MLLSCHDYIDDALHDIISFWSPKKHEIKLIIIIFKIFENEFLISFLIKYDNEL